MSAPLYVLVLAGGSGERFWPLSRNARPKQLLALFSKHTLLEATLERLAGLVPPENILVLTNEAQLSAVRAQARGLPEENVVAEPAKRDTAAAIALGVAWVAARQPAATMVVLPADHLITDTAGFQRTVRKAAAVAAATGELTTIGIKPTWPCPGFGYIEVGAPHDAAREIDGPPAFRVVRFREKPGTELAERFLAQGNFRWNAGMFIWTISSILCAFDRHAPAFAEFINRIHGGADFETLLREQFPALPKTSVDYAIMEKVDRVAMIDAAFDWDDVGSWTAIAKYLGECEAGNRGNCPVRAIEAGNNIVFTDTPKVVAMVGVHDLIVVDTPDALLLCHRHEAERIKQIVARVPPEVQ
jgi:mannose-1-phosphate guanylyltransferase